MASKPELLIFQLLDMIATPFQRLAPIFGVQKFNGTVPNTARCKWNGDAFLSSRRDIIIFGLTAAILDFLLPLITGGILNSSIEFLDPENVG